MAFPTYTYTLTNGSTADATQVQQNFSDILAGISDTTKDISVNAITCAGTATLNGNVILGTSSSKTLTVNASLSSSIPVGTTNSYDIGAASLGLRSIYLGASGGTVRLVPGSTSNWTLTLPINGGVAGQFLVTDGSGTTSWSSGIATNAQSASYALLTTDDTVLVTTGASNRTITLPTAVGVSGKKYTIKKVDSGAGLVPIATTSAQTVDTNASSVLNLASQFESLTVISDGANWQILQHLTITPWTTFTPTSTWSSNTTHTGFWRRHGPDMQIRIRLALSGAPTSATLVINHLPANVTVDTTKLTSTATDGSVPMGTGVVKSAGNIYTCSVYYAGTGTVGVATLAKASGSNHNLVGTTQAVPDTFANGDAVEILVTTPITNWF